MRTRSHKLCKKNSVEPQSLIGKHLKLIKGETNQHKHVFILRLSRDDGDNIESNSIINQRSLLRLTMLEIMTLLF